MTYPFLMIDVFASEPFSGNPLAVVVTDVLSHDEMLAITRWLNLSETAFLMPPTHPEADYSVRIFAKERELPFAGHPTLGTCQAWLSQGGLAKQVDEIVQECGIGLVRIRRGNGRLAFRAPDLIRSGPVTEAETQEIADILGIGRQSVIAAQWADNGPGWIAVRLASAQEVLSLAPKGSYSQPVNIGVIGPQAAGEDTAFEIRTFFTDHLNNLQEDPVTGSFNASAAQWLVSEGLATPPYVAAQGTCLGRQGRIYIDQDEAGQIWVGGACRLMFKGHTA